MNTKITLIGAGSVVFAKSLLSDILQFPELAGSTICLMDIDPARLRVAEVMTRKIITALGVGARVEATLDQRAAVRGAKYVICTIQVGGYKPSTVVDFEIPKKYGLRQTIADTLGVGGVFRALRTIPVINLIARDIAELGAPGCLLLNYTNPMAMNCWAVDRAVGIPHVGLCHSVQGTSKQLAQIVGLPYEHVSYLVAGINHMAFFLKFEYRGMDAYPLLFKYLERGMPEAEKVRFEMMRRTGYFVTESSEHQSEYVPYFIPHGEEMIRKFDVPLDEYIRRCEGIIEQWAQSERELLGGDGPISVGEQSHEYGSRIIHSMETNQPRVIYGNVPNRGLIDNLPTGACVEVPCLIDANGVQPTRIGNLPAHLAGICRTNINVQELTVEAAITSRREAIYHAVMLDPNTSATLTLDRIWAMCDELIEAHQRDGYLGQFKPVLRDTGRGRDTFGTSILAAIQPTARLDYAPGASNQFILALENRGESNKEVRLELGASEKGVLIEPSSIRLEVLAGESLEQPVKVVFPGGITRVCELTLRSETPRVLCQDLTLAPRRRLVCADGKPGAFELSLAGNPAGSGSIALDKEHIVVRVTVRDSKVETDLKASPWLKSCVELFFAADGPAPGIPVQLFVVPVRGRSAPVVLGRNLQEMPGIAGHLEIATGEYSVELRIPLATIGLELGARSVLFDLYSTLTAHGEAHSGGRVLLSGKPYAHENSSAFLRVEFS